jgi:hypothetical protein
MTPGVHCLVDADLEGIVAKRPADGLPPENRPVAQGAVLGIYVRNNMRWRRQIGVGGAAP